MKRYISAIIIFMVLVLTGGVFGVQIPTSGGAKYTKGGATIVVAGSIRDLSVIERG
jgi:hypothetical protein